MLRSRWAIIQRCWTMELSTCTTLTGLTSIPGGTASNRSEKYLYILFLPIREEACSPRKLDRLENVGSPEPTKENHGETHATRRSADHLHPEARRGRFDDGEFIPSMG